MTVMFLTLNIFFFILLPLKNGMELPKELAQKVTQRDFVVVQSFLYENYLSRSRPAEYQHWLTQFYENKNEIQNTDIEDFWFQISFRDGEFLNRVKDQIPYPDKIRYQEWRKIFDLFETHQKKDFSGLFGVSIHGFRWSHYITYQFIHASFLHLFSNMVILVLFGVLIEMQVGSGIVSLLYLLGGVVGGLFYSFTTGNNMAPLIGASGSVSALIAFHLCTEPRKNLRFFFFLFPTEGYFGDIYLPKWWLLPLLILGDINAILTMPNWGLSVAHTAHLGAILLGLVVAFVYKQFSFNVRLDQTLSWVSHPEESESSSLTP